MRKLLIIGLIIFSSISTYSQINTKIISFETRYPIPIGNNFINKGFDKGYSGQIDFGIDYNVINKRKLGIGVLLNASFLNLSETDVNLLILSPKVKVEYEIDLNRISILPQFGIGYSKWLFRGSEMTYFDEISDQFQKRKYKEDQSGLTIMGSTKFLINSNKRIKWFLKLSYEFTKLEKDDIGNSKFNRNIHLFYPGVGMTWNFRE